MSIASEKSSSPSYSFSASFLPGGGRGGGTRKSSWVSSPVPVSLGLPALSSHENGTLLRGSQEAARELGWLVAPVGRLVDSKEIKSWKRFSRIEDDIRWLCVEDE